MTCFDCGQPTLFDGVCIDCSNKRFNDYHRLKVMEERLNKQIEYYEKLKPISSRVDDRIRIELQKIKGGKN